MVYIREMQERSFLVFTTSGEGFRLRDFAAENGPAIVVAKQSAGQTASDIRALAIQGGKPLVDVPERSIEDYAYWHDQTLTLNGRYLPPPVPAAPKSWLPENVEKVVVAVVIAVATAAVLAWLGLGK
jgi:hypothetical protein